MSRKLYLLVLPGGGDALFDHVAFGAFFDQIAEAGDAAYMIDGNVAIVSTSLGIDTLTARLKRRSAGSGQFFIVDISQSDRAGNMVPKFWNFIRQDENAEVA
jgi:hypothetical protein